MAKMQTTSGRTVEVNFRDDSLVGKVVIPNGQLRNRLGVIPAGARCVVTGTWRSGLNVDGPACSHCRVRITVLHVHRDSFLLEDRPGRSSPGFIKP